MDTLPDELSLGILRLLSAHDLTQVGLACKSLNRVVTPLLWMNIELHTEEYHEKTSKFKGLPPVICPSKRFYHCVERKYNKWVTPGPGLDKAQRLFMMLQEYEANGDDRLSKICARIVSVCTVVLPTWRAGGHFEPGIASPGLQIWEVFPLLSNLEMLELYADHVPSPELEVVLPEITTPPLPKLRHAKLFGHIPRNFAAWVLQSAATLQRLELGMVDRLICGTESSCDSPRFRPLPEEKLLLNKSLDDDEIDDEIDGSSDYGSLDGEFVLPRPLGGFLLASITGSNGSQAEYTLPQSKHLYLCQPSVGKYDDYNSSEYSWSTRADKACLADWRQILLASNQTLEVLVLEQRPGLEESMADSLSYFMVHNDEGIGNETLVSMMEDILNISGIFPMLKSVYLYGMSMGANPAWDGCKSGAGIDLGQIPSRRLLKRFQQLGIKCEARMGMWCIFHACPESAWWNEWNGGEDDDEGDSGHDGRRRHRIEMRWNTVLARV